MSHRPGNAEIANQLARLSSLMEIAGENPFRIRAIRMGAESVAAAPMRIADIAHDEPALRSVPGIGAGIAALIREYVDTGHLETFEVLRNQIPEGLIEVIEIPGIGAKTAKKLYELAGIRDLESLSIAIENGTVSNTKGLGAKLAEKIAVGLESIKRRSGRHRIGDALPVAIALVEQITEALGGDARVEVTGSLRRWQETVGNIDLLATGRTAEIEQVLSRFDIIEEITVDGARVTGKHPLGFQIAIHATDHAAFGSRWLETTGPLGHLSLLGTALDTPVTEESEVYSRLRLPWIAPEFRHGVDELDRAQRGELDNVIRIEDVRGELHSHTGWSDGAGTIEEMAEAARGRGYAYLGISDHSQSLGVANGLDRTRLLAQGASIREASARLGFPLFRSSEVEVLRDGALDFDDETLRDLDVVIASTHTGLTRPRAELMARVHRTLDGGRVDILAHPSGRLIEERDPGDFNWLELFQIAKANGTALEINADPARLDLKAEHAQQALEMGNLIAINCDAHRPDGFRSLMYGVGIARRAFTPRDRVINCWEIDRLSAWLTERHAPR